MSDRVVDVHHHFLPDGVFRRLRTMADGAPRLVNDKISITLTDALHDVDAHLSAMDAAGVDAALLTYSGVSVFGMEMCRELNDGMAAVRQATAGRMVGCAHVPLDDPHGAVLELARCVRELDVCAVALPTSFGSLNLDDPSLDALWAAITEHDLPVVLHPALLPLGADTRYGMERSCARPFDTTLAAVRLLHAVLPRFTSLRVVLPHCGGTSVFLKGRLRMFFQPGETHGGLPRTRDEQAASGLGPIFEERWSRLWFDTAGTGGWAPAVEMALSVAGRDRLMFGSDYPLESHSGETLAELTQMVASLDASPADKSAIASGTAEQLFGGALSARV